MQMPGWETYGQWIMQYGSLIVLVVLFYFMLIRPQRKRDKAEREMRSSIEIGDEISTIGGLIGKVVTMKEDVITIESSSDRTKFKVYRWAIRGKESEPKETVEAPKEAK